VNQELDRNVIVERAFWIAAGLAVVGGVAPLLVAIGHTNRVGAVLFPFAAAALAMAALALFYRHGRSISALVYFLGGLAIAYGLLLVLSVPMRLAVEGSCPPAPERCVSGLEMQLSATEGTALTIAVAFGIMALLVGFIGLSILYRQRAPATLPPVWPARPPENRPPPPAGVQPEPAPIPEPAPEPIPEGALVSEPEPEPATIPEPALVSEPEPEPATIPEPALVSEPEPEPATIPEPALMSEPEPALVSEPEPAPIPEPALASEPEPPSPAPAAPARESMPHADKPKRKRRPKPPTG
jgi:hypothetical protein